MRLNYIKKTLTFGLFVALLGSAFLSSCNEDPTSLGYSLVKDTVELYAINSNEIDIFTKDSTYLFPLNFINTGISMLGRNGETKSGTLIRFGAIPDTLNYLTEANIVSAELTLTPHRYAIGDTAGTNLLSFGVHKVNNSWIKETSVSDFFSGALYSANPFASYENSPVRKDTMDKILLPFDKAIAVEWFQKQALKDTIWGIALVPKDNSTILNQFYGSSADASNAPYLTIIYNDKNNVLDTLVLKSSLEKAFTKGTAPASDRLVIEGATSYRVRLDFDISSIPKFAGIHKAELQLTMDSTQTYSGNAKMDSVIRLDYFANLEDEEAGKQATLHYAGVKESKSNKYTTPSLTSVLSYWNRRDGKGTLTLGFDNLQSQYRPNKLSFYTSKEADIEKRPKLTIIYSVLKVKENN